MRSLLYLLLFIPALLSGQIIADHSIVDQYDDIPQNWIDVVKTKWAVVVGASHAEGYLNGADTLEQIDPNYGWSKGSTGPLAYTDQYLRLDKWIWGDAQDPTGGWQSWSYNNSWWTDAVGVQLMRENFHYCIDNGFDLFAIWFGWSYDAVWRAPTGSYDPVYHTRWGGGAPRWATDTHPDGWLQWGLDSGDEALTGNSLSMQDYIDTMEMYIQYVTDNSLDINIVFSTGAVDDDNGNSTNNQGESGYQQYLKWEYIRDYVATQTDATYFIDYADILSYNDAGEQATTTWTDNNSTLQTYPVIHPENMEGTYGAHIGERGALKLGKATWWLLARIAGWEGISATPSIDTDITSFTLSQQTGSATINTTNHTVSIEVDYGTSVTSLTPSISVSNGATVSPISGTAQNFSSPVIYTVTAEDGTTTQEWVVTVTVASAPSTPSGNKVRPGSAGNGSFYSGQDGKALKF